MSKSINLQDGKLHNLTAKVVKPTAKVIYFDGTTEGAERVANALYTEDLTVEWDFRGRLCINDNNGYGQVEEEIHRPGFIVVMYDEDGDVGVETFFSEESIYEKYNVA